MKERPILMSAPMVRAILAGAKTQTRRAMRDQPCELLDFNRGGLSIRVRGAVYQAFSPKAPPVRCPYGQPGDRLWVREAWRAMAEHNQSRPLDIPWRSPIVYEASRHPDTGFGKLRSGMFLPRWASRITLEVTGVRVERLQDISEADAIAEGAPSADLASGRECIFPHQGTHRWGFRLLWESINGPGSWAANPWVWVVEVRRAAA